MDNIITINNLSFFYDKNKILDNLSYEIKRGSWITIIGNNGSGKSTLVSLLSGLQKDNNQINFNIKKSEISIVSPNFKYKNKTVFDELKELKNRDEIINEFGLKKFIDFNLNNISSSIKIIVMLAKNMASNPQLLILDNVLEFLDIKQKQKIIKILKKYHKKGMTIINITQKIDDAFLGDIVTIVDKGKIVSTGLKEDIFINEELFKKLNLELPFIVDLSIKLKYYDITKKIYFNMEELVDDIWK